MDITVPTKRSSYIEWLQKYRGEREALQAALTRIDLLEVDNRRLLDLCEEVLLALEAIRGNSHAMSKANSTFIPSENMLSHK